jgi:ribosome-binding factor A
VSFRRARVAQELRDRLAEIVSRELRDPRLGMVTIVDVEVSPDFSFARAFFHAPGDVEAAAAALEHAKPFVRRRLAERVRLRRVPELDFRPDASLEQGARVDAILDELAAERSRRATEPPEEK